MTPRGVCAQPYLLAPSSPQLREAAWSTSEETTCVCGWPVWCVRDEGTDVGGSSTSHPRAERAWSRFIRHPEHMPRSSVARDCAPCTLWSAQPTRWGRASPLVTTTRAELPTRPACEPPREQGGQARRAWSSLPGGQPTCGGFALNGRARCVMLGRLERTPGKSNYSLPQLSREGVPTLWRTRAMRRHS